jgi:hypothetical protein
MIAMQWLVRLAAVLLLLLSSNALYMLGINYHMGGGSPLEKLHPAFYIILLCLPLFGVMRRPRAGPLRLDNVAFPACCMLLAAGMMVAWAWFSPNAGGELSAPVVTFLMPALLLLVMSKASGRTVIFIGSLVGWFFLANSTMGIIGSLTGYNLLPQVAGARLIDDPRPTGLLGAALLNAQLTGVWLLYGTLSGIRNGFRPLNILELVLHGAALVAFGGRSALALVALLVGIYTLYRIYHAAITGRGRSLISLAAVAAVVAVAGPLALKAGLADVLLQRIGDDGGSADTRLAALHAITMLSPQEWLTGIGPSQRNTMLLILNTPAGIESFPLALWVTYGLPITLLTSAAAIFAMARLAGPLGGIGMWITIYFFASSAASLSLGSKSISLSLFVLILVALRTRTITSVFSQQEKVDAPAVLVSYISHNT